MVVAESGHLLSDSRLLKVVQVPDTKTVNILQILFHRFYLPFFDVFLVKHALTQKSLVLACYSAIHTQHLLVNLLSSVELPRQKL